MSEYMSIYDAADRFHITPQTIYYHVNRGHFKVIDKENGYGQLVDADEIQEMIDAKSKKKDKKEKKHRQELHLYEIITITCGQVSVLFKTCSHKEVAVMYLQLMEHGHRLCRIRMDGEVLTINDSDKLANKYHPRTKKGEIA